jgi:hypothetical protein
MNLKRALTEMRKVVRESSPSEIVDLTLKRTEQETLKRENFTIESRLEPEEKKRLLQICNPRGVDDGGFRKTGYVNEVAHQSLRRGTSRLES